MTEQKNFYQLEKNILKYKEKIDKLRENEETIDNLQTFIYRLTCDYKNSPYCIILALINAQKGNLKHGFAFAGENVYRTKEIISVKEQFIPKIYSAPGYTAALNNIEISSKYNGVVTELLVEAGDIVK